MSPYFNVRIYPPSYSFLPPCTHEKIHIAQGCFPFYKLGHLSSQTVEWFTIYLPELRHLIVLLEYK